MSMGGIVTTVQTKGVYKVAGVLNVEVDFSTKRITNDRSSMLDWFDFKDIPHIIIGLGHISDLIFGCIKELEAEDKEKAEVKEEKKEDDILEKDISFLTLNARACNCLRSQNIYLIKDLVSKTRGH